MCAMATRIIFLISFESPFFKIFAVVYFAQAEIMQYGLIDGRPRAYVCALSFGCAGRNGAPYLGLNSLTAC